MRKAEGGDIVLMHVDGNHTAEATDIAIRNLRTTGFSFVTIGQLLEYR